MARMAPLNDWCLDNLADQLRRERLRNPPSPGELLIVLFADAEKSANMGAVHLEWQPSTDAPGYYRISACIPVSPVTFDQIFNGRSGYRAQYYLSPEEGVIFNRKIVEGLLPVVAESYRKAPIEVDFSTIEQSLHAPHSKIWLAGETDAFNEAIANTLTPPRWVENGASLALRVPLPKHPSIDLKGAFIQPETGDLFVDELKLERPCDLHRRGFS